MKMPRKLVIIGGGVAGTSAALQARKVDRDAEITLINREKHPEYSRCGLPHLISGIISKPESLIVHSQAALEQMMKIKLLLETEAVKIDMNEKIVTAKNVRTNRQTQHPFDSLVLATGAKPSTPPIEGLNGKSGVYKLRTLEDAFEIAEAARASRSAAILGGSLIGMELAEALTRLGLKVTLIHRSSEILSPMLDPDMGRLVRLKAEDEGVKFMLETTILKVAGERKIEAVETANGEILPVDMLIITTGTDPDVDLAVRSGLKIGRNRGIVVDSRMCAGVEGVYAAGDCVEYQDAVSGEPSLIQLGTVAVRMGRVAGANAAGAHEIMPPLAGTTTANLFGLEIGSVGLTMRDIQRRGLPPPKFGKASTLTKPEYYPGGKPITMKVLVNPESLKIMGGQAVGGENVAQRINVLALAIQQNLKIDALMKLETCYAPSVAPIWDPLILSAENAYRKLKFE
jgi:NADH oxidase (H2O2-forming)